MWPLDEQFYLKIHLIGSVATLLIATAVTLICLFPALLPDIYEIIIDARISYFIPYLLFIALGESIFSLWYFNGNKKRDDRRERGQ
ncbi:MAG: hypothetical protein A2079_07720 [Geobacteraceae bacterium GWC2_48_7]|nr:MAG: hypothetical protein A2079_07720 [Geobacteraceae bacterium GWC2_48_7]